MSLFCWSAASFCCADGVEIIAWDPNIDAPTWRRPLSSPIRAVASGGALLASLEENGQVAFWNGRDGTYAGGATIRGGHALAMAWTSGCAVAAPDRVEILDAQGQRALPLAGATALRFARDDARLGVGFSDGRVSIVDVRSGNGLSTIGIPGGHAVTALFERAPGAEWLATSGDAVYAIDARQGGSARRVTGVTGTPLLDVAANERGTLFAIQAGDSLAAVLAWPSRDTAGSLKYPERKVLGVALGAGAFWVGLDKGDGNKLDLRSGQLYRTDPHEGRPRNRWLVMTGYEAPIAVPNL